MAMVDLTFYYSQAVEMFSFLNENITSKITATLFRTRNLGCSSWQIYVPMVGVDGMTQNTTAHGSRVQHITRRCYSTQVNTQDVRLTLEER